MAIRTSTSVKPASTVTFLFADDMRHTFILTKRGLLRIREWYRAAWLQLPLHNARGEKVRYVFRKLQKPSTAIEPIAMFLAGGASGSAQ